MARCDWVLQHVDTVVLCPDPLWVLVKVDGTHGLKGRPLTPFSQTLVLESSPENTLIIHSDLFRTSCDIGDADAPNHTTPSEEAEAEELAAEAQEPKPSAATFGLASADVTREQVQDAIHQVVVDGVEIDFARFEKRQVRVLVGGRDGKAAVSKLRTAFQAEKNAVLVDDRPQLVQGGRNYRTRQQKKGTWEPRQQSATVEQHGKGGPGPGGPSSNGKGGPSSNGAGSGWTEQQWRGQQWHHGQW